MAVSKGKFELTEAHQPQSASMSTLLMRKFDVTLKVKSVSGRSSITERWPKPTLHEADSELSDLLQRQLRQGVTVATKQSPDARELVKSTLLVSGVNTTPGVTVKLGFVNEQVQQEPAVHQLF